MTGGHMQRHEDLDPEPRGWLEKAQDFNIPTFVVIGFAVPVSLSLREAIGFWPAVALVTLVSISVVLLLGRILRPQQLKRIAADAERGLFECAHRERGSTLRGRWVLGYVKAEPGKFLF
ncbi:hypothetical protein GC088_12595 [Arthrobacter sp. JZ12]|uniref:hypothetical protein n=1 Tax=Arthrobacter sp. JZ12 TaxID=2654190 RepID=UPI002B484307|nr:hypothetical protein [Arthrobacter sp. JZ12]WRH25825.1 hypothetical protein GC088_12595 [Arthrobacter sp. JZ12]